MPFYVGIAKTKNRPYSKANRNDHWHNIVNSCGYFVEILHRCSWEMACELEQVLISYFGRVNSGTGILCNRTDGGEGSNGAIISKEHRLKISKANKGSKRPKSKELRNRVSETLKGRYSGELNPMFGRSHTEEAKLKVSQANKGRKHSLETRKKVAESSTGRKWFNDGKREYFIMPKDKGANLVLGRLKKIKI